MPTQVNWRFRQLCNAMFYDGLPSKFVCAGRQGPVGHKSSARREETQWKDRWQRLALGVRSPASLIGRVVSAGIEIDTAVQRSLHEA